MSAGKRGWYVATHCGVTYTVAESAAKAKANVKRRIGWHGPTHGWTAKEA